MIVGFALCRQTTFGTQGLFWFTYDRPEIHYRLVVCCRMFCVKYCICQFCKYLFPFRSIDGCRFGKVPRQYTVYIPIYDGIRQTICKGSDRCCSIGPHSFQGYDIVILIRETPLVPFCNFSRCMQEVSAAGIITQSLP
ncbi:hypothetical protein FQZ97_1044780 [compost metagenome]